MIIDIYTDGACSGNPGVGGWGSVIIIPKKEPIYLHGGADQTTNNQMELTAAIQSLKYLTESKKIKLYTDSKYVMNGMELWIVKWKKNGWKTTSKEPVKNKDLWVQLDIQIAKHKVQWQWVKGHVGNKNNEIADSLARKYIEES